MKALSRTLGPLLAVLSLAGCSIDRQGLRPSDAGVSSDALVQDHFTSCDADDALHGDPCDGDDPDRCADGTTVCVDGLVQCDDPDDALVETCNQRDDDCDDVVDEGAGAANTYYVDRDDDGYGDDTDPFVGCEMPAGYAVMAGDCNDLDDSVRPDATETCNGVDDDCDGRLDEDAGCPCVGETHEGSRYLFCTANADWERARDDCVARGMHLATIDSELENDWMHRRTEAYAPTANWWIGLNDRDDEGNFVWVDGSSSTYRRWHDGEPNDGSIIRAEDCTEINGWPDDGWNDEGCGESQPYACEAR